MRANKLTLRGDTLYVEQSPGIMVVPLQQSQMERAIAASKRLSPLASGYAPLPPEGSFRSIAWDDARGIPLITVAGPGDLPASFSLPPAPEWVATLANPVLLYSLVGVVLAYAAIAAVGFNTMPSSAGAVFSLIGLTVLAVAGLFAASDAGNIPARAVADANRRLSEVRGGVADVERDRARLRAFVYQAGGTLAPLTEQAVQQIAQLTRPRSFTAPAPPSAEPAFWAVMSLVPGGVLLSVFIVHFAAGTYFLFVRPPIWGVVRRALRRGEPVDMKAAKAALRPDLDEARDPPPAYQSESDAFHLETLRSEIEDAPASRQLPSGDRHVSILNKLRAATRLMGALVRRHVEHDRADSTASEPTKEDRELDARLAAARRRRDEAQHAYEDEVRRSGPRPGS